MEHLSKERIDEMTAALRNCGKGRDFCARQCGYRGNALCLRRLQDDAADALETLYNMHAARAETAEKRKKS